MPKKSEPLSAFWESRVNNMLGLDKKSASGSSHPSAAAPSRLAAPSSSTSTRPKTPPLRLSSELRDEISSSASSKPSKSQAEKLWEKQEKPYVRPSRPASSSSSTTRNSTSTAPAPAPAKPIQSKYVRPAAPAPAPRPSPAPAPAPKPAIPSSSRSAPAQASTSPKSNQSVDFYGQHREPPTHQRPLPGVQPGCTLEQQHIAAQNNGRRMDAKQSGSFKSSGIDLTHFELQQGGKAKARTEEEKAMDQMRKIWNKAPEAPSCVLDDLLYMAGRKGVAEMASLPISQFTHVVFSLNDSPLATPYACTSSFFVDTVDALDATIQAYFEPMCLYLEEAIKRFGSDTRICIHCQKGQSRSGALTVAFVMKHCKMTLKQAFEHVAQRKPDLRVNVAFISQLQKWEKRLTGCDMPTLSLKEADKRGWCKCYFALNEVGTTVNLGTNDWSSLPMINCEI